MAQLGVRRRDLYRLAANSFGFAFQGADEHSRRADLDAFAKTFLEGSVAELLGLNRLALGQDLVSQLAMGSLALRGKPPIEFFALERELLVTSRSMPPFRSFLDRAIRVEVAWIGRSPAPIKRAFNLAQLFHG